jgi:hypothetical protein
LYTEAEARAWLSDPKNWHESEVYILKWYGLTPTVTRRIGTLLASGEHSSLPAFVAEEQMRMRRSGTTWSDDRVSEEEDGND